MEEPFFINPKSTRLYKITHQRKLQSYSYHLMFLLRRLPIYQPKPQSSGMWDR
jgi:hypothetical protein